jgi:hypothetical protein
LPARLDEPGSEPDSGPHHPAALWDEALFAME